MSIYSRIIWVVMTIVMITINALATTQSRNGVTTGEISDNLSTLMTPAGFTFSIWSLIYLGLAAVAVLIAWKQLQVSRRIVRAYVVSCACNAAWIVVWQYGYLTASMLIIVGLLVSLIVIDRAIIDHGVEHFAGLVRSVFLIYFGWVQIATLVMLTVYLIYGLGVVSADALWWPITAIVLAGVINLIVIIRARRIETTLVALWALVGIYLGQSNSDIRITCLIVGGVLLLCLGYYFKTNPQTPKNKILEKQI